MARPTLLILLSALGIVCHLAPATARDDRKGDAPPGKRPAPSLKVGDAAPRLSVTKWVRGDPVKAFEPGRVYVIHFWATWCPPCTGHMPHLSELQARYGDRGVTVIGFTSRGIRGVDNNSEADVTAFVKKRGAVLKLGYTLAYADDGTTADAWLKAAGQDGFCTFVVDKAGRVAFMGSPMFLDLVLPKVLTGASPKDVSDQAEKARTEYETAFEALVRDFKAGRDLKPALAGLKAFETRYSPLIDLLPVVQAKLSLLPKYGAPGEAKAYAEKIVADGIKREDVRLLRLAYSILRNEKESKDSQALAVRAAETCVRIDGGTDARSLLDLADAYHVSGDTARAREYAGKAVETAGRESPGYRREIETEARKLGLVK